MNAMLPLPSPPSADLRWHADPTPMARAMIERLRETGRRSTAEMLEELRRQFPHSPLAVRVRALAALQGR